MNEIIIRDEIVASSKKNGKWFTVKEICDYCKCSRQTFNNFKSEVGVKSIIQRVRQDKTHAIEYSSEVIEHFQIWLMHNQSNQGRGVEPIKNNLNGMIDKYCIYTKKQICDICKVNERTFERFIADFRSDTADAPTFLSENMIKKGKEHTNYYTKNILKQFQTWLLKNQTNQGRGSELVKQNAMDNLEIGMAANAVMASGSVEAAEQFAKLLIDRTKQVKENMRLETENKALQVKNESLKIELDESKEWYSVKRMEKLNRGKRFDWRLLKRESERMGIDIHKVFDANYEKVNAYHISVWESLFYDTLNYGD